MHGFSDVTVPWQQDPVSWMAANDITTGTSPTTFSPDRPADAIDVAVPAPDAVVPSPMLTIVEHRNWALTDVEVWPDAAAAPVWSSDRSQGGAIVVDPPDDVRGSATIIYVSDDDVLLDRRLAVTTRRVVIAPSS